MNISKLLKKLRVDRHLSVKVVSEATGISKSCIYDYERGVIDPPLKRYYALLDFYGLNAEIALQGKEFIDITNFSISSKKKIWLIKCQEEKYNT